jgi:hypothetical protein
MCCLLITDAYNREVAVPAQHKNRRITVLAAVSAVNRLPNAAIGQSLAINVGIPAELLLYPEEVLGPVLVADLNTIHIPVLVINFYGSRRGGTKEPA